MRVIVCGGRDFTDYARLGEVISDLLTIQWTAGDWPPVFISGAARGADSLIIDWAARNSFECIEFPANWATHGKGAGPIRNQQMLDEGKPGLVVAFPGGRGTADMVARAKAAGVKVIEIPPNAIPAPRG